MYFVQSCSSMIFKSALNHIHLFIYFYFLVFMFWNDDSSTKLQPVSQELFQGLLQLPVHAVTPLKAAPERL